MNVFMVKTISDKLTKTIWATTNKLEVSLIIVEVNNWTSMMHPHHDPGGGTGRKGPDPDLFPKHSRV